MKCQHYNNNEKGHWTIFNFTLMGLIKKVRLYNCILENLSTARYKTSNNLNQCLAFKTLTIYLLSHYIHKN